MERPLSQLPNAPSMTPLPAGAQAMEGLNTGLRINAGGNRETVVTTHLKGKYWVRKDGACGRNNPQIDSSNNPDLTFTDEIPSWIAAQAQKAKELEALTRKGMEESALRSAGVEAMIKAEVEKRLAEAAAARETQVSTTDAPKTVTDFIIGRATKQELAAFALDNFDITLDMRRSEDALRAQVQELENKRKAPKE